MTDSGSHRSGRPSLRSFGLARGEVIVLMLTGATFVTTAALTTPSFLSALPSSSDNTANKVVLDGETARTVQRLEFVLGAAEATVHIGYSDDAFAEEGTIKCLVLKMPSDAGQEPRLPGTLDQHDLLVFSHSKFLHSLTVYRMADAAVSSEDVLAPDTSQREGLRQAFIEQSDFVQRFASLEGVSGRVVATDVRSMRFIPAAPGQSSRSDQTAPFGWIELTWMGDVADSPVRVMLGTPLPALRK
ncbi:MAG: hypothetical protein D8M59_11035 [Planctomycetes bacterium]|nr:hypothetical protein [Planctomycetota bacterium]